MIDMNDKELKQFEKDLLRFRKKAIPFATKNMLNNLAYETMSISKKKLDSKMTLRNKFTLQSVRYQRANGLDINKQESKAGSVAPYLETQENGGIKNKNGSVGVAIATGYSANQEGVDNRTKLPTNSNKMKNIVLNRGNKNIQNRKK